jgi:DNA-binding NarL/FixJ family response regulator
MTIEEVLEHMTDNQTWGSEGPQADPASQYSETAKRLKIMIIDDHPLFRQGLSHVLKGLGDVEIVEAQSFKEAMAQVSDADEFDLILADLCLPLEDGFAGVTQLRESLNDVPLVVISVLEDREDVIKALDCGARGYIPKSCNSDVMLSAVRLVLAGGVYLPPALIADPASGAFRRRGISEARRSSSGHPIASLTPRQLDVLALLGRGKSNREIAYDLGLAEGTVKVHVTAILKALGVKNRTQAVLIASEFERQSTE